MDYRFLIRLSNSAQRADDLPRAMQAEYDGAHGQKTAHYIPRWVYKGCEKGPVSEVVLVMIVA